eukprot:CAMPEP_0117807648 /NCGR_PEP_ID=MMETSP0948-20121206/19446_1 /TAXON_ID=44440 /ORGANISM="Chattonella subsalsa, Strain CCMP2191" /LENGTH=71 /DNA_ID=CAMNT_0005642669 /DNA_START=211 /DNA_END=429 /DNA_ORIENTATION=+
MATAVEYTQEDLDKLEEKIDNLKAKHAKMVDNYDESTGKTKYGTEIHPVAQLHYTIEQEIRKYKKGKHAEL